ncbi:TadE-like protein [Naumannella sp. ID2617S]|uniref:TadE-like protein n=1 Tax=Enemella dayhoffiae TaxID=2016507 RepID=A0A255H9A4_9ACTN|nr:Rv3654c family TadE-like protein [Enemella dayhoffiae]NNG20905.1 TadE-like protein [Naumannella sp. ID2617S]OYO24187.1 TadE-like protein [Enemella dayhoffiae]
MHRDRGVSSLLVSAVVLVVLVLAGAGSLIAGYAVSAHRARGAADLAAVSAAGRHSSGGEGCPAARRVAEAHGASVRRCTEVGDRIDFVISVEVAVPVRAPAPGLPTEAVARAHAGRLN